MERIGQGRILGHRLDDWYVRDPAGDVARSWVILMSGTLPEDTEPVIQ